MNQHIVVYGTLIQKTEIDFPLHAVIFDFAVSVRQQFHYSHRYCDTHMINHNFQKYFPKNQTV